MSFAYIDNTLHAEGVDVHAVAGKVGTPFYCYSTAIMTDRLRQYQQSLKGLDHLIAYSVKANSNIYVLKTLADMGAGADVVSGGELKRALAAGIDPKKIVFSGVGKTTEEIKAALDANILMFNVESEEELGCINSLAQQRSIQAQVSLRINPNIEAGTHTKISTGRAEDKFGIPMKQALAILEDSSSYEALSILGIDVHIGSQITEIEPFKAAFQGIATLFAMMKTKGKTIQYLDIGGGLGVNYGNNETVSIAEYCHTVWEVFSDIPVKLILEPGRSLVAEAGILVTSVVRIKDTAGKTFAIMDAGMNDLMRPALYGAQHQIIPARVSDEEEMEVEIVGPVCESSDTFARECPLPTIAPGDLLAIKTAGAYGASLASEYNTRPMVPEILVNGRNWDIIRKRPSVESIIERDIAPSWYSEKALLKSA